MSSRGYTKLSRNSSNRKALIRDLATQLIMHEKIETSVTKAKEIRRTVEKLITLAKKGDLNSARIAEKTVRDLKLDDQYAMVKLFTELGPRFKERNGGYTRIYKIGPRRGDSCPMAVIELV
ncbi:MAG: 50S ribosomal protein L17 [Tenericutes bacterium]|nr:50S ribosomal protein L17 [Mycoplasmatota bacterium]